MGSRNDAMIGRLPLDLFPDVFTIRAGYFTRLNRLKKGDAKHTSLEQKLYHRMPIYKANGRPPFHPALEVEYLFHQLRWGTKLLITMKRVENSYIKLLREASLERDQTLRIMRRIILEELTQEKFILDFLEARNIRTKAIYDFRAKKAREKHEIHNDLRVDYFRNLHREIHDYNKKMDKRIRIARKQYWIAFDKAREVFPEQVNSSSMNLQEILKNLPFNEAAQIHWLLDRVRENVMKAHADQLIEHYKDIVPNAVLFNYSIFDRTTWEKFIRRIQQDERFFKHRDISLNFRDEHRRKDNIFHWEKKTKVADDHRAYWANVKKIHEKFPTRATRVATNTVAAKNELNKVNAGNALRLYRDTKDNFNRLMANQGIENKNESMDSETIFHISVRGQDETDTQNILDSDPPMEAWRNIHSNYVDRRREYYRLIRAARFDDDLMFQQSKKIRMEEDKEMQEWIYRRFVEQSNNHKLQMNTLFELLGHAEIIQELADKDQLSIQEAEKLFDAQLQTSHVLDRKYFETRKINQALLVHKIEQEWEHWRAYDKTILKQAKDAIKQYRKHYDQEAQKKAEEHFANERHFKEEMFGAMLIDRALEEDARVLNKPRYYSKQSAKGLRKNLDKIILPVNLFSNDENYSQNSVNENSSPGREISVNEEEKSKKKAKLIAIKEKK